MECRNIRRILLHLELWQWGLGALAGGLCGFSKTGVPGLGILVVPLLAAAFGGRASVGIMLPMLIFADIFAVLWYRQHARWDKLVGLLPWVVVGLGMGGAALWLLGMVDSSKDIMSPVIGWLVLVMLGIHLLQGRLGERLAPTSRAGVAVTGVAAGFSTTVSNAAGPIMSIYMVAQKLDKNQFIGTFAWYFFIINLTKLPIYLFLSYINPANPMITTHSLAFNLFTIPAIVIGAFAGKWLLPKIPKNTFDKVILALAAAGALKLVLS